MRSVEALPDGVRDLAGRIVALDEQASVYLFGSRAMGCARPDSDWDLAAVASAASVQDAREEIAGSGPQIDLCRLDPATFEHRSRLLGTLEREVCWTGRLVAGAARETRLVPREGTEPGMRTRLLQRCVRKLASGISAVALERVDPMAHPEAGELSADAAEAVVKLSCLAFGKLHSMTHSIEKLCGDLPDAAWTGRLREFNGRTAALHMQGYSGIVEEEAVTIRRLELTVEVLRDLAPLVVPELPAAEAARVSHVLARAMRRLDLPESDEISDLRDLAGRLEEASGEWLGCAPLE